MRKCVIAADHAGFFYKEKIKQHFSDIIEFVDMGTHTEDSVDYPIFANKIAEYLKLNNNDFGILICGTGIGMCIAANRHKHIRAALCFNKDMARLSKEHNNANVIIFGSRQVELKNCYDMINEFLNSNFMEGRHKRRIDQLS